MKVKHLELQSMQKKILKVEGESWWDVDLFGFEQTSLAEKKTDFQDDMSC